MSSEIDELKRDFREMEKVVVELSKATVTNTQTLSRLVDEVIPEQKRHAEQLNRLELAHEKEMGDLRLKMQNNTMVVNAVKWLAGLVMASTVGLIFAYLKK